MTSVLIVYGIVCLTLLLWSLWHLMYNPKAPKLTLRVKVVFVIATACPLLNIVTAFFVVRSLWGRHKRTR